MTGEISIGSGEFRSTRYLSKMIASFREKHPLVRYQIYSGNSENIKERIERGILDFGLMMEPIDISKYEYISMPAKEKWGILVSELSELSQKETIQAADLQNEQLISARSEKMYPEIRKWFGEYYDQIEVIASGNLLYNEAILAQEQIGAVLAVSYTHLVSFGFSTICMPLGPLPGRKFTGGAEAVFDSLLMIRTSLHL